MTQSIEVAKEGAQAMSLLMQVMMTQFHMQAVLWVHENVQVSQYLVVPGSGNAMKRVLLVLTDILVQVTRKDLAKILLQW